MDTKKNHPLPSKIDQLVDDAKTELNRVGIETEGKRSDEILKMARQERNKPREGARPNQRHTTLDTEYVKSAPSLKHDWPIC